MNMQRTLAEVECSARFNFIQASEKRKRGRCRVIGRDDTAASVLSIDMRVKVQSLTNFLDAEISSMLDYLDIFAEPSLTR